MPHQIRYIIGDATRPEGDPATTRIIAHACNDVGAFGAGFARAERWPFVKQAYQEWGTQKTSGNPSDNRSVPFGLGRIQVVHVPNSDGLFVANMVAQRGLRSSKYPCPLDYDALRSCLGKLAGHIKLVSSLRSARHKFHASVHMPRIGCGMAGGSWDRVEPLVVEELCDEGISVTVYDLSEKGRPNR
jgi:O-acetyl-ADP-ribose deacetylase (regulator of RNase III)